MSYSDLASRHPYYDDFNPDRNFLRIVFNPGRAVQARELTQLQTILQNQVASMAGHFFKNDSIIIGAKISTNPTKPGVTIHNKTVANRVTGDLSGDPLTSLIQVKDLVGKRFVNSDPTVIGGPAPTKSLKITQAILDQSDTSKIHLYFTFAGPTPTENELFFDSATGSVVVKCATNFFNAISARCEPGIVWRNGHFISVIEQEIIVGNDQTLTYNIGFRFDEKVVTESDRFYGNELKDPANGFYNFNAPGAHRYQVIPVLDFYMAKDFGLKSDAFKASFTTYFAIDDGKIIFDQRDTQYAKILDLLASRTFDESGNYVVENFKLTSVDSPENTLTYSMSPGKAYVLGYEIKKIISERLVVPRARVTQTLNSTYARAEEHFYFVVKPGPRGLDMLGQPNITDRPTVQCYSKALGTEALDAGYIGTCRVESLVRVGTEWRLYVSEFGSIRNHLKSVKSIRQTITGSPFSTNGFNVFTIPDTNVTSASVQGLRRNAVSGSSDGLGSVSGARVSATGTQYLTSVFRGDQFPFVYPVKGATFLRNVFPGESSFDSAAVRQVTFATIGAGIVEATITAENDRIRFQAGNVQLVAFQTPVFGGSLAVPLSGDVNVSVNTSVSPHQITITIDGASGTAIEAAANKTARVYLTEQLVEAAPRQKSLARSVEQVSVPFNLSLVTDRYWFTLSREDGYRLTRVRIITNSIGGQPKVLTEEEMKKVKFDDGQRDTYYDKVRVSNLRTALSPFLANSSATTQVEFTYEYFEHSNAEHQHYFSVNSYPFAETQLGSIPTYKSSSNGRVYDLVNCVDFRVKKTELGAGKKLIVPESFFDTDAEIYLPRIDKVSLSSTGEFIVTEGIPSQEPEAPNDVSSAMTLYVIQVNPYTKDRRDIKIVPMDHRRYTMRDIGKLEKRIERLEYYTAMSLLEQSAANLTIIDSASGFDKFKSGIFADPFNNHALGDTTNEEYRCAVFPYEGGITCPHRTDSVELSTERPEGWTSDWFAPSSVAFWRDLVTLTPTDQVVMAENRYASNGLNVNPYLFYVWNGLVTLTPAIDTWFDTVYSPEVNVESGSNSTIPESTVIWGDWEANWVGTSTTVYSAPVVAPGGTAISVTATTTTTNQATTQSRPGIEITYRPTETITVDDRIIDVSSAPYMRPIRVRFEATGMRQGMIVEGFMDGVPVVLDIDPEFAGGKTDSEGRISGFFQIPAGTFTAGTKRFSLVDNEDTSSANTTFTSQGSVSTRLRTITTVRGVEEIRAPVSETGNLTDPLPGNTTVSTNTIWIDPIAQSFLVNSPGGAFISSIDIFFKARPTSLDDPEDRAPVSVYLVEMENGYPTQNMVPFAKATKNWVDVSASDVAPQLGQTTFTFENPIYLENETEYAFVVFSNSRKYEVWISTLGEQDVFQNGVPEGFQPQNTGLVGSSSNAAFTASQFVASNGEITVPNGIIDPSYLLNNPNPATGFAGGNPGQGIAQQPYLGSLFKSQNSSTWTADQLSDITFRINRYIFGTGQGSAYFTDQKYQINARPASRLGGPNGIGYYNRPALNLLGPLGVEKKMTATMLSVGDMAIPGTQIKYAQRFFVGEPTSGILLDYIQNKSTNFLGREEFLGLDKHYVAKAELATANPNISPVIDKHQNRLICIENLAFDNEDGTFDAGARVTQAIKLLNGADDLKVLVDAKLPDNSEIAVYFKTQQNVPEYFEPEPGIAGTHQVGSIGAASLDLVGDIVTLYARDTGTGRLHLVRGGAPGTDNSTTTMIVTSILPASEDGMTVDAPRVYFRSLSTFYNNATPYTPFSNTNFAQFDAPSTLYAKKVLFADSEVIIPNLGLAPTTNGNPYVECPDWSGSLSSPEVAIGRLVFHAEQFWKRVRVSDTALPNPQPTLGSEDWVVLPSISIDSAIQTDSDSQDWRRMVLEQEPNPQVDPATQFVEYTYKPEIQIEAEFLQFQIKIEMISRNTWGVPIVKSLRAVAAI